MTEARSTNSSSTSSTVTSAATPRYVFMVRCASGVTTMSERAVDPPVVPAAGAPGGPAEIRVQGARRVGRPDEERARGRPAGRRRLGLVAHAGGPDVVGEHLAQLVVAHLAHEPGGAAARRHAHRR